MSIKGPQRVWCSIISNVLLCCHCCIQRDTYGLTRNSSNLSLLFFSKPDSVLGCRVVLQFELWQQQLYCSRREASRAS